MLNLKELKRMQDRSYEHGQVNRESASDDLVFAFISQWDDQLSADSQLSYRGEFDILRKAIRQVMSDLRSNPIQVDFQPKDPNRDDGADVINGLYRKDDRVNTSIESYDYASQDAVVTGFGAWELYTDYETNLVGDCNQVIKRRYLPEACNTVFYDPSAKCIDKSDAKWVTILYAYAEDGYKDLVEELTGERPDVVNYDSFKAPEQSYVFPWATGEGEHIYVGKTYHRKKVKDTVLFMTDPLGSKISVRESELDEYIDDMKDLGFKVVGEKKIERWEVRCYIASGSEILNGPMGDDDEREGEVIAGEYIPVPPVFGERAFIEGVEHYEGIVRKAKDPQRMYNFAQSYLSEMLSSSPREKPIFTPEQLQGFEEMFEISGADNNYPYVLQNMVDTDGQQLPMGPVGMLPAPNIPPALNEILQVAKSGVEDVANPGLPQNIADPDLSGKAVSALQNRMDMQTYIYQHNLKMAKRYDGMVYASMSKEIYSEPRMVRIELPDGTSKSVQVMEKVIDDNGNIKVINDLASNEFDVFSDIGPSYKTQREEEGEKLTSLLQATQTGTEEHTIILMKMLGMMDGHDNKDLRDYSRKKLLLMGLIKPETDDDNEIMQEAAKAQQNKQDPNMVLAQGELMKGQAALKAEETKEKQLQVEMMKLQIKQAEVNLSGTKVGIDAQKTKADIANTNMDTLLKDANREKISGEHVGIQLDNVNKVLPQQAIG